MNGKSGGRRWISFTDVRVFQGGLLKSYQNVLKIQYTDIIIVCKEINQKRRTFFSWIFEEIELKKIHP